MKNIRNKLVGANPPEAWAVPCKKDQITGVSMPSIESVLASKEWVDENEK
jgi:hypothetical protein